MKREYYGITYKIIYYSENILCTSPSSFKFMDEEHDNEYKDEF